MMADRVPAKGRKPMGPRLVRSLDGSQLAKQRLEVILETMTGKLTIAEACQQLAISEPRFYQLRTAVLEAGLACLEPRPLGRPPLVESVEAVRIAELTAQLEDAKLDQQAAEIRAAIAAALPRLQTDDDATLKKTPQQPKRRKLLSRKRSSRKPR